MKHRRFWSAACATTLTFSLAVPAMAGGGGGGGASDPTPSITEATDISSAKDFLYVGQYNTGTISVTMYNMNDVYVNPYGIDVAVGGRTSPIDAEATNNSQIISPTDFIENKGKSGLRVKATVTADLPTDGTTNQPTVALAAAATEVTGDSTASPAVPAATDKRIYAELQIRDCVNKTDAFADNADWSLADPAPNPNPGIEYGKVTAVKTPATGEAAATVIDTGVTIGKPTWDNTANPAVCTKGTFAAFRMHGVTTANPKKQVTNAAGDLVEEDDPWTAADKVDFHVAFTFQPSDADTNMNVDQGGTITGDTVLEPNASGTLNVALNDPDASIATVNWKSDNPYVEVNGVGSPATSATVQNNAVSGQKATITATVTDTVSPTPNTYTITCEVLSASDIQGATLSGGTALTTAAGGTKDTTLTLGGTPSGNADDSALTTAMAATTGFTWTSTNPEVATVTVDATDTKKAKVEAVGSGKTTIIVSVALAGGKTYAKTAEVTVNWYGNIDNLASDTITGAGDVLTVAKDAGATKAPTNALFTWSATGTTFTGTGATATVGAVTTPGDMKVKVEIIGTDGIKWWAEKDYTAYSATGLTLGAPASLAASGTTSGAVTSSGSLPGGATATTYQWTVVDQGTSGATISSGDDSATPTVTITAGGDYVLRCLVEASDGKTYIDFVNGTAAS